MSLTFPDSDTSPATYSGPAGYKVINHAGQAELSATLALDEEAEESYWSVETTVFIDESDSDPITALGTASAWGTLTR